LLSFNTQCGYLGCSAPEKQTPKNHDSCILVEVANAMVTNSVKPASGAIHRFPKRELSPLRRACLSLGLPVDARPGTNLARLLRKARLGKTGIGYLKFSKGEEAQRIVALHDALNATERKAVTIDYLVMAAGADVHHVSGLIQEGLSRATECEAGLLASMNAPAAVDKAIQRALTFEGHQDRKLVFELAGVIPAPTQPGFTHRHRAE
jgi:hypothetical protein